MNLKRSLSLLASMGIAMIGQAALAAVIDVNYAGSANFGSGPVGYQSGSIVPNPNSNTALTSVAIGGNSFTSADHTFDFSLSGQFNAWCVDIYDWLNSGASTYIVTTESDLADQLNTLRPGTGTIRVNALVRLANEVYASVDTETESAAFQLAVWAIAFGTADSSGNYHINATDSDFRVDSATVTSAFGILGNSWLANLDTAPNTGNYALTYLSDGERNVTQDMIVFVPQHSIVLQSVPEPATLALLGLGLTGLGFSRRKQ